MPTIVVTGSNGFIGSNVLEKLLSLMPEELGFHKGTTPRFSSSTPEKSEERIIRVIASDLPESLTRNTAKRFAGSSRVHYVDHESLFTYLKSLPTPPNLVVHNGACSSTTEKDPVVFEKLNWGYTQKMWDYCARHQVPLIYASSAAVYGDGTLGFSDKKEDCTKYTSLNLYGKSKLDFDLWALKQKNTPPTWFGLRYFNVFGQFESHKGGQASMVYHGYHQALKNGCIRLFKSNTSEYTDGNQVRDFVYVDDIVDVTIELMRICIARQSGVSPVSLPGNGLFLNIGNGREETWNHLATLVFKALNLPSRIEYIPMLENIANQYQNYTCADLSTLRSIGVTHTFKSFEEGVTKYVQRHLTRGS